MTQLQKMMGFDTDEGLKLEHFKDIGRVIETVENGVDYRTKELWDLDAKNRLPAGRWSAS